MKKITGWKTKGMNRDISVSAFNNEFSFENINLRVMTNEGNTALSWVNEKGTAQISIVNSSDEAVSLTGTPIGTAVLNSTLIMFTTSYRQEEKHVSGKTDRIYKLSYKNAEKTVMKAKLLFTGNLNFSTLYPLETMVSYEAEHIQKVYWVDGRNQPRIINVADANEDKLLQWHNAAASAISTFFDFQPTTQLQESVTITRVKTGGEMFPPGVIQYCFTYINRYGQQTNIAWTSALYYLTYSDRGVSPEDEVVNAFSITITSPDVNFDYLRLYSIQRTSIDATPVVKMLDDIPLKTTTTSVTYTDSGTTGYAMDPTELLYVGGRDIIANTMADKDNTLFLGNFSQKNASLNAVQEYFTSNKPTITFANNQKVIPYGHLYGLSNDMYINSHTLVLGSKRDITTFKGGETYRFGFQLQKNTGEWTDAIFLNDAENNVYPSTVIEGDPTASTGGTVKAKLVHAQTSLNLAAINTALYGDGVSMADGLRADYKKIRPVVVYPTVGERTVLCQGVVNPTLFNITDRVDHSPFAQSSWYFRPYMISTAKDSGEEPTIVTASLIPGANASSVAQYNSNHPAFPNNPPTNPYTTGSYNAIVCNIPESRREEVLKRGYLVYRRIIYAEFRFDDGSAPYVMTSSAPDGGYNYERTPWDGKLYFYGAIPMGNEVMADGSVSTFGGDAYLLLLNSSFILPHDTNTYTPNQEMQGKTGTVFQKDVLEYQSPEVTFMRTPSSNMPSSRVTIYSGLKKENGMLYYLNPTGNTDYNNYTFQVYYEYMSGETVVSTGIQFTLLSTANGYIVITNNKTGNGVAYAHYSSLPTQDGIWESNGGSAITDTNRRAEIEIQGSLCIVSTPFTASGSVSSSRGNSQFFVDQSIITMHSPDIEFDTEVQNYETEDLKMRIVGIVPITSNASAHRITTSSSMLETSHNIDTNYSKYYGVGETGNNIVHKNIDSHAGQRLVADYLWNDAFVLHDTSMEDKIVTGSTPNDFMIFPWHRQGALNNDPRSEEEASSWLKTKKESNILYSLYSNYFDNIINAQQADHTATTYKFANISTQIHLTENDFIMAMKLPRQKTTASEIVYYPNIDKVLYNSTATGYDAICKNTSTVPVVGKDQRVPKLNSPVYMRYKSTSHAVIALNGGTSSIPVLPYGKYTDNEQDTHDIGRFVNSTGVYNTVWGDTNITFNQQPLDERPLFVEGDEEHNFLWLAELYKTVENRFGGEGEYAIKNNKWLPCGDAVAIPNTNSMTLKWTDGDTFYQRYDNLKTYAFSEEDQNQIVEILSFMCETRVNIDGRYDRNRGQMDNTLMRPGIFNLLNPVYSQSDNFFTQRGVITDSEDTLTYPNQITYSKTKTSGADVDLWTNVTLASTLELDGDKGSLNKLIKVNDQIVAFQDTGISQVLYNENVQIASTTGVPIEIANSGKVDGKRYITDTIGCSNKWSVVSSPYGVYFMDSHDKSIYMLSPSLQLTNLSTQGGMNVWSKNNIPGPEAKWDSYSFGNFKAFYDKINQETIFGNYTTAIAWSEKVGAFTSFYNYENTPFFNNLDDTGIWIRKNATIWKHQAGTYCNFFGTQKPYSMTLVGNPEPQIDKIFTNIEMAACVEGEGTVSNSVFTPYLPFSHLEVWNEYQHGTSVLSNLTGHNAMKHFTGGTQSLKRKFRLWRCDIPRDNASISSISSPFSTDLALGIKRFAAHPVDRMRNPWLYLKLHQGTSGSDKKTEIHDVVMTYFS